MNASTRLPAFPLIRHLSRLATPFLLRLPVTANQISLVALAVGLAGCWFFTQGGYAWMLGGGFLFLLYYVLDHCDGEVARARGEDSPFGHQLDTFVDWLVHSAFFVALGIGWMGIFQSDIWLWLGGIAAAGGTINYALVLFLGSRDKNEAVPAESEEPQPYPEGLSEWVIFAFRELSRSDFCFIVLGLALLDLTWLLLPAGAIGSQVYWIMLFSRRAREFHA